MLFRDYVDYYTSSILSMGKTSSIRSTKSRLKKVLEEFGDSELPLSSMEIQKFITKISSEYPAQTTHNVWGTMRTVLQRAKADGVISEVPVPILPRIQKVDQDWFQLEEMRTLARYEPMYAVAAETGARIGEILALQIGDIDLEKKTIHIRRNIYGDVISAPKTRAGNRCISISGWLVHVLQGSMEARGQDEFLFQTIDGEPRSARRELEKLYHACEIFGFEKKGFHAFRRGNATIQASIIGVPEKLIAYRLGHANIGLTLSRYAKYLPGMDKEYAEQIGELLR